MEKLLVVIVCFLGNLIVLSSLIFSETTNRTKETIEMIESQRFLTERKIESLESEIRILKQDIYILENGYTD